MTAGYDYGAILGLAPAELASASTAASLAASPSLVLRGHKTPPHPSRQSSVSLDHAVPPATAEMRRSPTFVGNPSESVPRARDSGGSTRTSLHGSRDAAFREANDVGIRDEN